MKNLNGFLEFDFKKQINAFDYVYKELLKNLPKEVWSFGGGTALSLYRFRHRASFDIDIFINDPQYFSYLSPKFYLEESDYFQDNYIETANQISLRTKNNIKVDFVLTPPLTKRPFEVIRDNNKEFQIETIKEIIAKKIFYRKKDNKTRDILDIAYAINENPLILKDLLDEEAINLDILFDFKQSLNILNQNQFIEELEKIMPSKKMEKIGYDAKNIILENIDEIVKLKKFGIDLKGIETKSLNEVEIKELDNKPNQNKKPKP